MEATKAGFNAELLSAAVAYAIDSEIKRPRDINVIIGAIDSPPSNKALGAVKERGQASGLIIKNGYQRRLPGGMSNGLR